MKTINKILGILALTATIASCGDGNKKADGYGNFEATEITVSAESNGKLIHFDVTEGITIAKGTVTGVIDTTQLSLKKAQLEAGKNVIYSKSKGVLSQINVLKAQRRTAIVNKKRVENLIKENAGTQKQLDDVIGKIDVINQQIRSVESQNAPIVNEIKSLDAQLAQINDQIKKSSIINPIKGTVLVKYVEPNEITAFGRPLYKIADLTSMILRVYISETQLANVKVGQTVTVKIDAGDGMKDYSGKVSWVAANAEFTPKIIQTKEERVNLVYAVKIDVKNDGSLKIGMPAEMWIGNNSEEE